MCGIVGAVAQRDVKKILLEGLLRLEYRGYDSAGIAIIDKDRKLQCLKKVSKVSSLIKEASSSNFLSGQIGIAHTRWATHGKPTESNTHPHTSDHIVVVHNGIIENYESLREKLRSHGYIFYSDTDTETIAHFIHWEQKKKGGSLVQIVRRVVSCLKGNFGIIIMDVNNPNVLVAVRSGSPIVVGSGISENFLASDQIAIFPVAHQFFSLEEGDIVEITYCSVKIWDKFGCQVNRKEIKFHVDYQVSKKGHFCHFMKKEIFEQPKSIKNTIKNYVQNNELFLSELSLNRNKNILTKIKYVQIIACGTSYHSALISKYWFESLLGIYCNAEIASEFRYRKPVVYPGSLIIGLSQSGETTDTLEALRFSKSLGYLCSLSICNVPNSSITKASDISLMTYAGLEISVASTKTFTAQLTVLLLLIIKIIYLKNKSSLETEKIIFSLKELPRKIEEVLLLDTVIEKLAKNFIKKDNAIFIGRGYFYPIAMEGALKVKEISYIHAEAYASGELKHGPLALIDSSMPVIVVAPKNNLLEKLKSNIEEIRARGGKLYIFTEKDTNFSPKEDAEIVFLPHAKEIVSPILYSVALQMLAYHIALVKGKNIDQPRNLAKSVTVE